MQSKLFSNIKKLTTIFSIAILCITLLVLILKLTVLNDGTPTVSPDGTVQVEAPPLEFSFDYEMSDRIVFTSATSSANPRIRGVNSNTALMQIKIIRNDNKRSIYESSYLRPGVNLSSIKLSDTTLEPGEYECTMELIAVDQALMPLQTFTEPVIVEIGGTPVEPPVEE